MLLAKEVFPSLHYGRFGRLSRNIRVIRNGGFGIILSGAPTRYFLGVCHQEDWENNKNQCGNINYIPYASTNSFTVRDFFFISDDSFSIRITFCLERSFASIFSLRRVLVEWPGWIYYILIFSTSWEKPHPFAHSSWKYNSWEKMGKSPFPDGVWCVGISEHIYRHISLSVNSFLLNRYCLLTVLF